MSVRSRVVQGVMAAIYGRGVLIVGQVLTVPILITRWGAGTYGEWIALSALVSYLSYTNIGIPGAVRAEMAIALSRNNEKHAALAFRTCLTIVTLLVSIGVIVYIVLLNVVSLSGLLNGAREMQNAKLVASAFTIQVGLIVISGVFNAALSAIGKYGLANFLDANRQLMEFSGIIIIVGFFSFTPNQAVLVYPFCAFLYLIGLIGCLLFHAPWLILGPWAIQFSMLRRLSGPMFGILGMTFGYYGMSVQAPRLILAATLGPVAVATYGVTTMLLRMVRIPIDIPAHAATVEISLAHGRGDANSAQALIKRTTRISFWLAIFLIPFVAIFGTTLVHVWTNGRLSSPLALVTILSLSTIMFSLGLPSQEALMSIGRLGKVTFAVVIFAPFFVGLAYVLTRRFGLVGMGVSILTLDALYSGLAVKWVVKEFRFGIWNFLSSLFVPPIDLVKEELEALAQNIPNFMKPGP